MHCEYGVSCVNGSVLQLDLQMQNNGFRIIKVFCVYSKIFRNFKRCYCPMRYSPKGVKAKPKLGAGTWLRKGLRQEVLWSPAGLAVTVRTRSSQNRSKSIISWFYRQHLIFHRVIVCACTISSTKRCLNDMLWQGNVPWSCWRGVFLGGGFFWTFFAFSQR